jgi:predicted transglutaminase-like protease
MILFPSCYIITSNCMVMLFDSFESQIFRKNKITINALLTMEELFTTTKNYYEHDIYKLITSICNLSSDTSLTLNCQ